MYRIVSCGYVRAILSRFIPVSLGAFSTNFFENSQSQIVDADMQMGGKCRFLIILLTLYDVPT